MTANRTRRRGSKTASARTLLAQWVQSETDRLFGSGRYSFASIARLLTRAANGDPEARALVRMPPRLRFRSGYRITPQACCQAYNRVHVPVLDADSMRRLNIQRLEDVLLQTQAGTLKGHPGWLGLAIKVVMAIARLDGSLSNAGRG